MNPAKLPEGKKIQDYLIELTDGGLDYTFDCTGNVCYVLLPKLVRDDADHSFT